MKGSPAGGCPQRVGDALRWAAKLLVARQIETPRLDAELLLAHVLGVERPQIQVRWHDCLTDAQIKQFTALVRRRTQHEPVAYLIGERAFFDVDLYVTPSVLIPRPETEHLVEAALDWATEHEALGVVDVGTGSGALAVVLARHLPRAHIWAVDLSYRALHVAARNLERYGLDERVALLQADLLEAMAGPLDLVVANLPYIRRGDIAGLAPNVRAHEPQMALDGGPKGLDFIFRLIDQLPDHLNRPGLALLEIDHRQAKAVVTRTEQTLPRAEVDVIKDYAGLERVVRIERQE